MPRAWIAAKFSQVLASALLLGGCGGASSIPIAGAYFPAWLLCALFGVLVAAVARAVFVRSGAAALLPLQFFVCTAIGAVGAALLWWVWVGL